MHSTKQRQANGYVGLSVLTLFAVAIIAGQARGDLNRSYLIDTSLPTALELGVLVEQASPVGPVRDHEAIRKFRTMPVVIDFGSELLDFKKHVSVPSRGHETAL